MRRADNSGVGASIRQEGNPKFRQRNSHYTNPISGELR
jgi:hypothetical protein